MKNYKEYGPSFCFIAPTAYLEGNANRSKTHLVLAHLVDTDPAYTEFYKRRSEFGDLIILDNSAYELKEPFSPSKLIELGKQCGANVIVLPDYPFQHSDKTIAAANEFIPVFKEAGFGTFFVPQSKMNDLEDWVGAYTWAANNPDIDMIGMSILGIPNAIPWCDPAFARVVMTAILIEKDLFNFDKHHHYLGLNSGPGLEIPTLINMGVLDTIDSSGPIWAAILGHGYTTDADSLQSVKKLKMPVRFDYPKTKDPVTLERIGTNINLTLELFNTKTNQSQVWYAQE
jgi:hypothetical protein